MNFNNLKELEKYLNKKMASALQNEVAEKVRNEQQFAIEDEVYDRYQPNTPNKEPWDYVRRREKGGLSDRKNMKADINQTANGVELSVKNTTKGSDSGYEIAGLIEYGDGYNGMQYDYKENRDNTAYQYLQPRPFTKETVEELERTSGHVDAMRKGLKRQGLDVE